MRKTSSYPVLLVMPPNVSVLLTCSENSTNFFIEVCCNVSVEPVTLFNELHAAGFERSIEASPLPDGSVTRVFVKHGSSFFGGCTPDERRKNLRLARKVLRRFGFSSLPMRVYSTAELL